MKVASFTINHDKMLRGVYISRKDNVGEEIVTTFDIRIKVPNKEPVIDNPAIHTLEHLMAVYLRGNEEWADKVIYVGPMGCRTGMYLILKGDLQSEDIIELLKGTFKFIMDFDDEIPATTSKECGNYLDHNLVFAKYEAEKYYNEILLNIKKENMIYPE